MHVEKLIQVFARLFFVTSAIFLPAMARFRRERKTVLGFHEKALQGLGSGESFVVGYSSEEFFKKFSKHFALEGVGRLYFEREAILFEGSTPKEDSLEMRFFSKVARVRWVGRSWRNGIVSWFSVEQNGRKHYFASDSILEGVKSFGRNRGATRRIYEAVLKKSGEDPDGGALL